MLYHQCEGCGSTHDREKSIYDCNECGEECCSICSVDRPEGYYCSQHCADCN